MCYSFHKVLLKFYFHHTLKLSKDTRQSRCGPHSLVLPPKKVEKYMVSIFPSSFNRNIISFRYNTLSPSSHTSKTPLGSLFSFKIICCVMRCHFPGLNLLFSGI